jgi:hypothetical protein
MCCPFQENKSEGIAGELLKRRDFRVVFYVIDYLWLPEIPDGLCVQVRDSVDSSITKETELQAVVLACLYLSYSYMGNEIRCHHPTVLFHRFSPGSTGC